MADEKSLIAAESALVSRLLLASQAGLTFAGARDTYAVLGYDRALNYKGFRQRYLRDDLAQRIVKAFPKATWSTPPDVIEDDDPDNVTDFERAFRDLASRLKLWSVMERLDRLAQIGRYAVLLVGVPGELETEAKKVRGPEGIAYLQAYSEDVAVIDSFVADSASDRFGLPAAYKVDLLGDLNAAQKGRERKRTIGARTVHASRVVHFAEDLLDDNVFGRPRLEPVWNRLDDLAKVVGGGAEAFWITANRGMEFALKDGATMTPAAAQALEDEANEFGHGMRRILRTAGVETKILGAEAADGQWLVDGLLAIIAGTTGIPKRILTGSEEGSLASTQDRHNWNERVAERERMVAEPMALRPLIDLWIRLGALPQPKGDFEGGYKIEWPAQRAMTEVEQAQIAQTIANAATSITMAENIARLGGFDPAITAAEWRDKYTDLPGAAQGETKQRKPAKEPEPTEPAPTANAKDPALDQVKEAIGRRAQAETWQNAIEAWAMTELAMQGADIIAVFDSLGIVSAWLRSNDEAPLSIEEKAKVEAAIAALKKSWEKRTEKAASPVFEAVITEAGKSAAKGIAADFAQARDAMQAFVEDYSFQFAKKTSETSAEIVRGVLDAAVNEGKTIAQVRADLLTRFTQDVPRAQMIARTETIRASNAGAVEVYKASGVTLKKWITAGDACPFCQQFEGMTIEVDGNFAEKGDTITADGKSIVLNYEDVSAPPAHPACRCAVVAVVV